MEKLIPIGIFIAAAAVMWWMRRGIFSLIYGIVSWIFIIIFVINVNPVFFNYLYNDKEIYTYIYDRSYQYADENVPEADDDMIEVPEKYTDSLKKLEVLGVDVDSATDSLNDTVEKSADNIRQNVVEQLSEKVTELIIKAIALLAAFIIAKLICMLVKLPLKIVLKFFKISY